MDNGNWRLVIRTILYKWVINNISGNQQALSYYFRNLITISYTQV